MEEQTLVRLPLSKRDYTVGLGETIHAKIVCKAQEEFIEIQLLEQSIFYPNLKKQTRIKAIYHDNQKRLIVPYNDMVQYRYSN